MLGPLLPRPPEGMTHVEAAEAFEFPTEESIEAWHNSNGSWFHTDDVVREYGALRRMNPQQMARFVFDQTARDWGRHTDFTRATMRAGLGQAQRETRRS